MDTNVSKAQIIEGFAALSTAILSKDEAEIKKHTIIVNEALAKADPKVMEELAARPNGPAFQEVVEGLVSALTVGKKLVELFARWRGL